MKKNRMKSLNPGISKNQNTKSIDELAAEASIEEEKQPYKVPDNWFWTRLGSVTEINMGQSPIGEYTTNESKYTPLIGGPSDMGDLYPNISRYTTMPIKISKKDDIIISVRATLGRTNISNGIYCLGRGVAGITPIKIKPFFLINFFKYNTRFLYELASGTTFLQISKEGLSNFPLSLPSLEEQHRIVEKLDSMLGKIAAARELIQEARESFEARRNAILHKAFTGELTKKWREENKDVEPASKLMETIQNNIKIRYEEEIKKSEIRFGNRKNKFDNSIFESLEFDKNFKLPPKWAIHNIISIADSITDGEHVTPKRTEDGYLLLSARNIQNGYLNLDKVDHIPKEEYIRITKRCNPEEDDLLVSCSGSVGRVCRVPKDLKFGLVRSVALIKLQSNKYLSRYLEFLFQSDFLQNQISRLQKATAQANLFIGPIGRIVTVIPPLEEQKEIVKRLNSLLRNEEEAKELIDLENCLDSLERSILSRAFRGQLGTNDPQDKPAIELLKTILIEKEEMKRIEPKRIKKRIGDFMDKNELVIKSGKRFNLLEILKESNERMKPLSLLEKAGYNHENIEQFYMELKHLVENNEISEERPNDSDVFLGIKNHEDRKTLDKRFQEP